MLGPITAQARIEFHNLAQEFSPISLLHYLQARWGFYGLPLNFDKPCVGSGKVSQSDYTLLSMIELSSVCCTVQDMECGYNSPLGSLYRKYSDQQMPIWEASTALYPRLGP